MIFKELCLPILFISTIKSELSNTSLDTPVTSLPNTKIISSVKISVCSKFSSKILSGVCSTDTSLIVLLFAKLIKSSEVSNNVKQISSSEPRDVFLIFS